MRNGMTISHEPHRLHGPLSAKLRKIRSMVSNVRDGSPMSAEDLEALDFNFREMTGEAERLEDSARDADAAVPMAYDLVCQSGDELRVLTSLLAAMVGSHQPDADHQVRCAFARARALIEKAETVFLGKPS